MDKMGELRRTHYAEDTIKVPFGETVTVAGFVARTRDLGNLIFADLRDNTGILQLAFDQDTDPEVFAKAEQLKAETVIMAKGVLRERSSKNKDILTGSVELFVTDLRILNAPTEMLPFEIRDEVPVRDELSLKYRYLELRKPSMTRNLVMRHRIVKCTRDYFDSQHFLEIETPMLIKSTPEGARDYIVPSRVQPGHFYALPQSPQIYKQILMVAGYDRYMQIVRCFRDEDLRADRQPEFTQIDLEMSFVDVDDVIAVNEGFLKKLFHDILGKDIKTPFRRMTWDDAMAKYGSDKPDLRNPLIIKDVTDILSEKAPFFEKGKVIKAIAVDNFTQTRKWIDALTEKAKLNGASNMYWFKLDENGELAGGIAKFAADSKDALVERLGLKPNSFVALLAEESGVEKQAGYVRTELGVGLDLLEKNAFRFCWIVDFPMYEYDDEGNLTFCHNPFSMPQGGLKALEEMNPLDILAYQYDSVVNGVELSSGAVRNHEPAIMEKAFAIVGYGKDVIEEKFSALYNAFKFGAPPHAGIAPGVDRIVMLLKNETSIREIITFPMDRNARDVLMGAPSTVTEKQLREVHISINLPKQD